MSKLNTASIDAFATANSSVAALCFEASGSGLFVFDQQASFFMLGEKSTLLQVDFSEHFDQLVARVTQDQQASAQVQAQVSQLRSAQTSLQSAVKTGGPQNEIANLIVGVAGVIDSSHATVRSLLG